jgi:molybdopterin adenylyltransferase|tara:strand:+ start:14 stop:598 length:585 start_codon:yes stop_codon:yes gene_type:complete
MEKITIGIISISDRASAGIYKDEGIPELKKWLSSAIDNEISFIEKLVSDDFELIKNSIKELASSEACLILTTGGTGPSKRDVTPDATEEVLEKILPGFGEQMRQISLKFVPTAILSRQIAGILNEKLIINLPGQPKSIKETLEGLRDKETNKIVVNGIFAAVPYCIDLLNGPYIFTNDDVCKSFRPKKAIRPRP